MTAKEKIYKWIEENREEVTGLLQKLIIRILMKKPYI